MNIFIISNSLSQTIDYPRIEIDSLGKKVVVMTIEQAQKVDNNFELLDLLEKAAIDCENLNNSYIKVIDDQKKTIKLLEIDLKNYKDNSIDKDKQIANLQERLTNAINLSTDCEKQKIEMDDKVKILKGEITTLKIKRNIGYGAGVLGLIGGVFLILLVK